MSLLTKWNKKALAQGPSYKTAQTFLQKDEIWCEENKYWGICFSKTSTAIPSNVVGDNSIFPSELIGSRQRDATSRTFSYLHDILQSVLQLEDNVF